MLWYLISLPRSLYLFINCNLFLSLESFSWATQGVSKKKQKVLLIDLGFVGGCASD